MNPVRSLGPDLAVAISIHAIPQIRDDNKLDVVLAASYGDSIGRAEYSGEKVEFLKPILKKKINIGGIVNQTVFVHYMKYIDNDIDRYHAQFPEKESYMQNELDHQLHYMRRMLNPCMELLAEKMEFYQVFTHPEVYGFMWSIKPGKRNNLVYKYMLREFFTKLDDIPWARTGLSYGQEEGTPDFYLKRHHSYVNIIQKEIFNEISALVLSDEIKQLGIFDQKNTKTLIKLIKCFPANNLFYFEKIIWLASLAEMTKIYNIKGLGSVKFDQYASQKNFLSISIEYFIKQSRIKMASILRK